MPANTKSEARARASATRTRQEAREQKARDEAAALREIERRDAALNTLHTKARKQCRDLMGTLQEMSKETSGFVSGINWHQGGHEVHLAYSCNLSLDGTTRQDADGTIRTTSIKRAKELAEGQF